MKKRPALSLICGFLFFYCVTAALVQAQDGSEDTVRVSTRVVFVDTLVKDKKTKQPVRGLARDEFQVFDNNRPRTLSYFSREDDKRGRPLALVLAFCPDRDGAGKPLRRKEVLQSLNTTLAKLSSADEVAVMVTWGIGPSHMLTNLTTDRAKVSAALASIPAWIMPDPELLKTADTAPSNLGKALQSSALTAARERPNSQVAIVLVTDAIFPLFNNERDEITARLIETNVSFNVLTTGMDQFFIWMYPVAKPLGKLMGMDFYGNPRYLAQQTGGEEVRVRRSEDYAGGLAQIIGNLTTRYSLGFTLDEGERDDGQMHQLEVKVKARDKHGKERKVVVSARRGYYLPKAEDAQVIK
ncbi:MAG: VWA domain-containing protein [Pyrinomonadaceae bacterium]|nr:VWA domain-containing protein [Pyrinomonadaceae bacterium]